MDSNCARCSAPFKRDQKHLKYCSLSCSIAANKDITQASYRLKLSEQLKSARTPKICEQCKCEYLPHCTSRQRFCTRACCKAYERLQWGTREKR